MYLGYRFWCCGWVTFVFVLWFVYAVTCVADFDIGVLAICSDGGFCYDLLVGVLMVFMILLVMLVWV